MTKSLLARRVAALGILISIAAACSSPAPAGPAGPGGASAVAVSGGETATISKPGGCGKDAGDAASWNASFQTDTLAFMLDITLEKTFAAGTYATGAHEAGKATVFMYAGSGGPSYDVVVGAGSVKADPGARAGTVDVNLTDARSGKSVHVVGAWTCESWD